MSFSIEFRGVGAQAKRDAQRRLRAARVVSGGTQADSPRNATLDALSGIVAMLSTQYPDGMIEGNANGYLNVDGGSVSFNVRIREARQGEVDAFQREDAARREREAANAADARTGAQAAAVPQRVRDEQAAEAEARAKASERSTTGGDADAEERARRGQGVDTDEGAPTNGTAEVTGASADTKRAGAAAVVQPGSAKPTGQAGSAAVGQRTSAQPQGSSAGSGNPPRNA